MNAAPPARRYTARAAVIGEDTRITRALPHRERRTVGAWCFLDHLGPVQFAAGKGMHVGAHPHIGLQTFTWMIEGEVVHRDSLGNEQIIRPGQVNLMTAGRGIAHSEDSMQDGTRIHAAQLWIALPATECHRPPGFQNYAELPVVDAGGLRATILAGSAFGRTAPTTVYTPLVGIDFAATGPAHTQVPLRADFEYCAVVLRGAATVADETLAPGEWLYFAPGRDMLELRAATETQLLLLGGVPFDERLIIWWNLVARTQGEIETALTDWKAGRFAPVRPGSPAEKLEAPSLGEVQLCAG
ncbi:MAG: pirin family protein [Nevskiaceae bacterium]|nr:MAG: pirin family protein [Nevskiaceae bacterium]TBR72706.1 MAG: pirin family protein [Nevskiaceae bacterium]